MRITFKLYASLTQFLPSGANGHAADIEVEEGTTPIQVLERHGVPAAQAHLVLINGLYVPHDERDRPLKEGDILAAWPPVAGG
jgi:molybdopterin converting factor small subunit